MTDLSSLIAKLGDCPRTEIWASVTTAGHRATVNSQEDQAALIIIDAADAALLELAKRCDALSRPEVALRMWKARAESAEARVAELERYLKAGHDCAECEHYEIGEGE